MYDYLFYNEIEFSEYNWTNKITSFSKTLWAQSYHQPDLKKEIQKLAFDSAECALGIVFKLYREFDFPVKTEEEAKECEEYFCEKLWSTLAYLAIDSIPATQEETRKLLNVLDWCTKVVFREDLSRREMEISRSSRAEQNLTNSTTVKIAEEKYLWETKSGRLVPFGSSNWKWVEMMSFMREGDELYEYSTSKHSWQNLAGEEGVCLMRGGEVIGEMVTCMN